MPEHSMSIPASEQNQQLHAQVPPGHTVKYSAKPDPRFRRGECLTAWVDSGVFFKLTQAESRLAALLAVRAEPGQIAGSYTTPKISHHEFTRLCGLEKAIFYLAMKRLIKLKIAAKHPRVSGLLFLFESVEAHERVLKGPQIPLPYQADESAPVDSEPAGDAEKSTCVDSTHDSVVEARALVDFLSSLQPSARALVDSLLSEPKEARALVDFLLSEIKKARAPVDFSDGVHGRRLSAYIERAHARRIANNDCDSNHRIASASSSSHDHQVNSDQRSDASDGQEPEWERMRPVDFKTSSRMLNLFEQGCELGWVDNCEPHRRLFFTAAAHVRMRRKKLRNQASVFGSLIKSIRRTDEDSRWARILKNDAYVMLASQMLSEALSPSQNNARESTRPASKLHREPLSQQAMRAATIADVMRNRRLDPRGGVAVDIAAQQLGVDKARYFELLDEVEDYRSWTSRASPPHIEPAEHGAPPGHGPGDRVDREGSHGSRDR